MANFYETATNCKFFTNTDILSCVIPPALTLQKGKKGMIEGIYNFKTYILGITEEGVLCGFLGTITQHKKADIVFLKKGPFSFSIHERRFQDEETLDNLYAEPVEEVKSTSTFAPPASMNYYNTFGLS